MKRFLLAGAGLLIGAAVLVFVARFRRPVRGQANWPCGLPCCTMRWQ
jgi:hypothetical protein